MNPDGEIVWSRNFGNKDLAFWMLPVGTATTDGGVIACTITQWAGGDISHYYGDNDVWVVKVDSLGNIEWETTLGTDGYEIHSGITLASDGGYYVSMYGQPWGNGSIAPCTTPPTDLYDGLFAKLDSNGNVLWNRCYGGSMYDQIHHPIELEDGLLLLCDTQSEDRDAEGAGYHHGHLHDDPIWRQTTDIWLIKTDFDGNIVWSKCYGGTQDEYPIKAFLNEDGGFTVFGLTHSLDGDVTSTNNMLAPGDPDPIMGRKVWMFRTDAQGNLIWERAIGLHSCDYVTPEDVIKHNDKEYTIAATAWVSSNPMYQGDYNCSNAGLCAWDGYWVFHVTDIFNYDDPTGVAERPQEAQQSLKVYPNPATTWASIDYVLPADATSAMLVIANTMGVKVLQTSLNGNTGQKVLDLRGLADGVYMVNILSGEYTLTEKLVITK